MENGRIIDFLEIYCIKWRHWYGGDGGGAIDQKRSRIWMCSKR